MQVDLELESSMWERRLSGWLVRWAATQSAFCAWEANGHLTFIGAPLLSNIRAELLSIRF